MQAVPENKTVYLKAEDILAAHDLEREEVEVPEWGGIVTVQAMNAGQRMEYAGIFSDTDTPRDAQAKMVQMCLINQDGTPLFTPDEVVALSTKSPKALERIVQVAMRLSGLGHEEEIEGN